MSNASQVGLLICQDLMFLSKVTGTAHSLGMRVEATGLSEGLIKAATGGHACIFLDLGLQPFAVADLTRVLPAESPPPVIAFGSHVDTARLDEARQAGCREVVPRSYFNSHLPEILAKYLGSDRFNSACAT